MRKFLQGHRAIIILTGLFIAVRLYRLTAIPIFNDEAIYLDWGWREVNRPNNLFYSLYDAKPPLLMWLFGLASMMLPSLLLAGRSVSILFGYLTLVGLWKLANMVSSRRGAIVAVLLYIIIPIFSFFDRQALMESAIGAIGVWACYTTLRLTETRKIIWAVALGFILGTGYFIKLNAVIFVAPGFLVLGYDVVVRHKSWSSFILSCFIVSAAALLVVLTMIVQPQYWQTLPSNARYALTFHEMLSIPWRYWLSTLIQALEIMFVHLTPLCVIFLCIALIQIVLKRSRMLCFLAFWFLLTLGLDMLFARSMNERYLVSFLPPVTILASAALIQIKKRTLRIVSLILTMGTAISMTVLQICSPISYFTFLSHFSQFSFMEYRRGFTSGYGVPEAVQFLEKQIGGRPAFIAIALHTGNPENGIMDAFRKHPNVYILYMEGSYIKNVDQYDCFSSPIPIYFVSRENDTAGLDRFFKRIYFARNQVSGFGIGIYTLKDSCIGRTLRLLGQPS